MPRLFHTLTPAIAIAIAIALGACGSGGETVVRFEGASPASIGKQTLDHWMRALAGSDIREDLGTEGPTGLASEPANPKRCFAAAKLVAPRSYFNQLRVDSEDVSETCRQLHQAIKEQALSFLISAQWTLTEAAERGLSASSGEVEQELAASRGRYPTDADLRRYLRERQWSLADLLYQIKLALLGRKLHSQSERPLQPSAAGPSSSEASASLRPRAHITTSCAREYVVAGCSAYRAPSSPPPSASLVLARLTGKELGTPQ